MIKLINALLAITVVLAVCIFVAHNYQVPSGLEDLSVVRPAAPTLLKPHPLLEAYRLPKEDTSFAATYEWIMHYYRHPCPDETAKILDVLLSSEIDLGRKGIHFFAAILHEHSDELQKLKTTGKTYNGKSMEMLTAILNESENYEPVGKISSFSTEFLWAEYMATGKREIIERMIQALASSEANESPEDPEAVQFSFYKHTPFHSEVLKIIREVAADAEGVLQGILENTLKVVDDDFVRVAYAHLQRALNHQKQREYGPALDEYEKALEYYPDYQYVFINLANMYEDQGKMKESFEAMKKAAEIDPNNSTTCYGMGRHYFLQHKYDEAISWYSRALKLNPRNHLYMHGIARGYQQKGDTANAVKYFQQYLKEAPDGEHVNLVKMYLASVKVRVEIAETLPVLMKKKDYKALESRFGTILKEKKKDRDGLSLLSQAYDELINNSDAKHSMEEWLGRYEDWLRKSPSSHFANAAAGAFYIRYAWNARGAGYSNTVTDSGYQLFRERLLKAGVFLEEAYKADPSDPIVPSNLIDVATGLGLSFAEMEKQFQRAIKADSTEYNSYSNKMHYLKPEWYGSNELMLSFARSAAIKAPSDSLVPLLLADAHWHLKRNSDHRKYYFLRSDAWSELKPVYITLCQRFPESKVYRNDFAYTAFMAGDFQTAAEQFEIIGEDWTGIWGSYEKFVRARDQVLRR